MRPDEQRFMRTGAEFQVGDRVRVVEGVLEGHAFSVEQIAWNMAGVFGTWFGAEMGFDVPTQTLEKE